MIKLFKNNDGKENASNDTMSNPVDLNAKSDMFQNSSLDMLGLLKSFALDIQEIQVQRYKEVIDELLEKFEKSVKFSALKKDFEKQKKTIQVFIEDQKRYVLDREKELRDIIDLMTKAMAGLNAENHEFYQNIYDQGEKILEISLLDDIKRIRLSLQEEVEHIRTMVDSKKDIEARQIQVLAGQVVELQRELEQAKAESMTDGLTGAYNRHSLDVEIAETVERYKGKKINFCLLLLDLDDFKRINDTYGHLIGDRMLIAFAQKCQSAIRGNDFFARYGGEEFAIILQNITLRDALNKASEICKKVAAAKYALDENQSEDFLSITVSIGVTPFNKGDTVETLIERADKALYDAKRKGKNMAIGRKK